MKNALKWESSFQVMGEQNLKPKTLLGSVACGFMVYIKGHVHISAGTED